MRQNNDVFDIFENSKTSTVERRVSVYAERYLQGALPMGVKTDCSWLEVRVLKAKDRDEHKIKLLQLVAD